MSDDLYFVRVGRFVKIGRSKQVQERLRQIGCHTPLRPKLVGTLPGAGWQEKSWHMAFCNDRSHREWFRATNQLRAAVGAALRGEDWTQTLQPDWRPSVAADLARANLRRPTIALPSPSQEPPPCPMK